MLQVGDSGGRCTVSMVRSVRMEREGLLEARLQAEAARLGWRLRWQPKGSKFDATLALAGRRYRVVLNSHAAARSQELCAALADAGLRARAAARVGKQFQPMAVVAAPRLSAAMCEQLRSYAHEYLPDVAWGAFDLEGAWCFPALEQWRVPASRKRSSESPVRRAVAAADPFSDLGQWLAKVLLAPEVPESWLSAPRQQTFSRRELARLAEISLHSTQRWLAAVRQLGFLVDEPGVPLRLMQRNEFLQHWASAAMLRKPQEVRVRSMRSRAPADAVNELAAKHPDQFTLGLHSACKALGVGIVRGALEHVYFHDPDRWPPPLAALGLTSAPYGSPGSFVIRRPIAPQSLVRGRVQRGQVWCADILQCYVDLAQYPVRGEEQAEEILRRLEWPE
jgi:catechol 2,3-dioxygenase-like lactoylglutathione lyase family enzyme